MDLGIIYHILLKLESIYFYEKINLFRGKPYTDKRYQMNKKRLEAKVEKAKTEYEKDPSEYTQYKYKVARKDLRQNVSPSEYNMAKQDIEVLKANYIEVIPEKYWNYDDFLKIYLLLKNGDIKTVAAALRYIDTY